MVSLFGFFGSLGCFGFLLSSCSQPIQSSNKLSITATFYPLAHFAEKVGGDLVEVRAIVPAGSEPHEYEPTPQDLVAIESSKLFLLNGAAVDAWAQKIAPQLQEKGITVVEASIVTALQPSTGGDEDPSTLDPHIWLDPVLAEREVTLIRDTLITIDPLHEQTYRANADAYLQELASLDHDFQTGLQSCALRDVISSHNAFQYLGRRYDIHFQPIAGISPEEDPSPKRIAELSDLVKEKGIRVVFFETLASPKIAQTIARETGATSLVLNPLEGLTPQQQQKGEGYTSVMRENLQALKQAMHCP